MCRNRNRINLIKNHLNLNGLIVLMRTRNSRKRIVAQKNKYSQIESFTLKRNEIDKSITIIKYKYCLFSVWEYSYE